MRIVITGSPGTGKSSVSKALSKALGLPLIGIREVVRENGLLGKDDEVDLRRLARALSFLQTRESFIIEGHLACEIPLPADWIFVLRTKPGILRRRLLKRKYGKEKLEENIMAEMLDYCSQRARREYGLIPLELDTSRRSPASSAGEIRLAIKHKKKKLDHVDYTQDLLKSAISPKK